jgi:hypothetical protein
MPGLQGETGRCYGSAKEVAKNTWSGIMKKRVEFIETSRHEAAAKLAAHRIAELEHENADLKLELAALKVAADIKRRFAASWRCR